MSKPFILCTTVFALCMASTPSARSASLYWDTNGATAGAGAGTTAPGIWGTDSFWSTDSTGLSATGAYLDNSDVVFSAGTSATGTVSIQVSGTETANSITFEEGTVTLGVNPSTGGLVIGAGGMNLASGLGGAILISSGLTGGLQLGASQTWTNASTHTLGVNAFIRGSATTGNTTTLTFAGTATINIGTPGFGGISDGTGGGNVALIKSGTSTLNLNVANTYSGDTTVNAGQLVAGNSGSLGTGGSVSVGTTTSGASLSLVGGITINKSLTIIGAGNVSFGALTAGSGGGTWAGTVTLGDGTARLGASAGTTLTVSGGVKGSGTNQTLTISGELGTGTVLLTAAAGNNAYTGGTNFVRGKLLLGADNTLPTTTVVDMHTVGGADSSTLDLNGFNQTIAGLQRTLTTTASTVTNSAGGAAKTLTINQAATGNVTYGGTGTTAGTLAGNLALVKGGVGTLTLSAANTYSGGTDVVGGSLSGSLDGAFGTGNVSVESTAISLSIQTGVKDAIADTATLSLAGGGTVGVADAGFLSIATGVNDTVSSLFLGGIAQAPGVYGSSTSGAANQFNEYFSGGGTITVIPEPGSGLLLLAGLGGFAGWRRNRSRK